MPELKLGAKFECYNCGTKFYDLGKSEPLCPKCGANQKDAVTAESPASGQSSRRRRKAEVPKAVDIDEEEPVAAADEIDDELVEPDLVGADLGDDEVEEEEDLDDED